MSQDDVDDSALIRLSEWIYEERVEVSVIATPFGQKLDISTPGPDYQLEPDELDSLHAAVDEWEDILIDVSDGDLEAVSDVRGEVWDEFLVIAQDATSVGEEELQDARREVVG